MTNIKIDPALNKYENVVLFPEKLAMANKKLEKMSLPNASCGGQGCKVTILPKDVKLNGITAKK